MNPVDETRLSSLLRNPATRSDSLDNVSLLSDLRRHPMQNGIAMQDAALMHQQAQALAMVNDPSAAATMRLGYPHDNSSTVAAAAATAASANTPFPGIQQDGVGGPHSAVSLLHGLSGAGGLGMPGVGSNPYQHLYPGMFQMPTPNPSNLNGSSPNITHTPTAGTTDAGLPAYGGGQADSRGSTNANAYAEEMLRRLQAQKVAAANAYGALGVPGSRDPTLNVMGGFMGGQQLQQRAGAPGASASPSGLSNTIVAAIQLQSLPSNHPASTYPWFVCQKCGQRAFSSEMELIEHDISCPHTLHLRQAAFNQNPNDFRNAASGANWNMLGTGNYSAASQLRGDNLNQQAMQLQKENGRRQSYQNDSMRAKQHFNTTHESQLNDAGSPHTQRIEEAAAASKPASRSNKTSSSTALVARSNTNPPDIPFRDEDGDDESEYKQLARSIPLSMSTDSSWITPLHCFVREHCVEIFTANDVDVYTPSKGKRRPIHVGQVGIRCPHCHSTNEGDKSGREKGSVYYPTTIASIYNATMNLLQRHLSSCDHVPNHILQRYSDLKADDARSGTSKKYWVDSARSLGLVDTPSGIRISGKPRPPLPSLNKQQKSMQNTGDMFSSVSNAYQDNAVVGDVANGDASGGGAVANGGTVIQPQPAIILVLEEDKSMSTAFSFTLLTQMRACVFTEADRLGKRKGLPLGFSGLACKHCYGGYGSGRFFPSSIKTMSDTSKTLNVLHCHMMRCRKCPLEVRLQLQTLRLRHDEERAKMKFGSQKAFFTKIWERLHGESPPDKPSSPIVARVDTVDAPTINRVDVPVGINPQQQQQQQFEQQIQEQTQPTETDKNSVTEVAGSNTATAVTNPSEVSTTEPVESSETVESLIETNASTSETKEDGTLNEEDGNNTEDKPSSLLESEPAAETKETSDSTEVVDIKLEGEAKMVSPSSSPVPIATETNEVITSELNENVADSTNEVAQIEETPQVQLTDEEKNVMKDSEVTKDTSSEIATEEPSEENEDTTAQEVQTKKPEEEENGVDSINPLKRTKDELCDVENETNETIESDPNPKKQRLS